MRWNKKKAGRWVSGILLAGLLLTGCTRDGAQAATSAAETEEEILVTDVITNTAAPVWTRPAESGE